MKTKLTWLIWLAVIGGVAWYLISVHLATGRQQQAAEKVAETKQQQKDATLAVLALKYNAVTNWEASMPNRGLHNFSIDVSRALIQSNGQPVLIIMGLVDVEENSNSYTASFSEDVITTNGFFQLYAYLKCTQEQADYFLEKTGSDFSKKFAVIAHLDEVGRPSLKVSGSREGEDSNVDIDTSTGIYFAFGKLLDAISLP
jgi:hypothetical protein